MDQMEKIKTDGMFLLERIAKLVSIPICRYRAGEETYQIWGENVREHRFTEKTRNAFFEIFTLPQTQTPVFRMIDEKWMLAEILRVGTGDEWILLGPVLAGPAGKDHAEKMWKKHREWNALGYSCTVCSADRFASCAVLAYWAATGKVMSETEFWKQNQEQFSGISQMEYRMQLDMFRGQENFGLHNPYDQEKRELASITEGNQETLRDSLNETYAGKIGILAKDPLRHHKNVAIGNITLASRAAIAGGVRRRKIIFHGRQFYPAGRRT